MTWRGHGRHHPRPVAVGVFAVSALAVGACSAVPLSGAGGMGGGMMGGGGMDQSMMDRDRSSTGRTAPSPVAGATQVRVIAGDMYFEPSRLEVSSGVPVNLILDNEGAAYHDLTIPDLGFTLGTEGGRQASGSLAVTRPGEYEFHCSVPGHAVAGMTGTLTVE
jgi:plastocyanin